MGTAGDGFLAVFDGPARAVRAALAACDGVRELGLEIRAGAHTGEIEREPGNVKGIAVHIGARVAAAARPFGGPRFPDREGSRRRVRTRL